MKRLRLLLIIMPLVLHLGMTSRLTIKPVKRSNLAVPEPSDIALLGLDVFIVSDRGVVFRLDTSLRVQSRSNWNGIDFEAITVCDNALAVADERTRLLRIVDPQSLDIIRTVALQYNGSANQGIEGLAYDPSTKIFYACIEKSPCMIARLDSTLRLIDWIPVNGLSDISAATFYNDRLFLLSDEDHCIAWFDLEARNVRKRWHLPVNNPEGIAFDSAGNVWVVSDDEQALYKFNPLPL